MRSMHLLSASLAMVALDVAAAASTQQQGGILAFPLKASPGSPVAKDMTKRQTETGLESHLSGTLYTIDVTLGTPGQTVSVQFDTGSAETWVNAVCAKSFDPELCESMGRFTDSTSFVNLDVDGGVTYGIGYVDFTYGNDYLSIGDARLEQQIFGVAYDSESVPVGILGVGPDLSGWESPYPFVLDNLVSQGFINSRAFSLDIRSIESDRGSVIFGGIDTSKYSGHLEKLPIVPASDSPDGYTRYWASADGLTVIREDGDDVLVFDGPQTFLLDSGYTYSGFPAPIFNALLEAFPSAIPIPGSNQYSVDCALTEVEGTLDFTFGSTIINVPYRDFILQQDETCYLGAFLSDTLPILGDTFLRAAYVVYDWDNRQIHIANNEDCGTNIVPIGSGPDAVPSIEGGCGLPTTTTTSSAPTSTTSSEPTTTTSNETTSSETSESGGGTTTPSTTESTTSTSDYTSSSWGNATYTGTTTSSVRSTVTTPPTLTSTLTTTSVYTITSCPPSVTDCPLGHVTTEVVTRHTTYCPGTTATYTLTQTHVCTREECLATQTGTAAPTVTSVVVITVPPVTTHTETIRIPGCSGSSGSIETTTVPPGAPALPTGTETTALYYPSLTTVAVSPPSGEESGSPPTPTAIPESGAGFVNIPGVLAAGLGLMAVILF